jgi:branched-chain amino acid transport system ATP-binding protein
LDFVSSPTLGEEKRLELARSLATNPRLLLLDEVLGGLSASELLRRIAVLRDIHAKGTTIVMIEHVMRARLTCLPREVPPNPLVIESHPSKPHRN